MRTIDTSIFNCLYNLGQNLEWVGVFMTTWTRLSALLFFICTVVLVCERIFARKHHDLIPLILSCALGFGLTKLIRMIHARSRPFTYDHIVSLIEHEATASFPSMHATMSFVIAASILLIHRKFGTAALLAAILTAVSRVIVGVHFPSDVVAGALIGSGSVFLIQYFYKIILKKHQPSSAQE